MGDYCFCIHPSQMLVGLAFRALWLSCPGLIPSLGVWTRTVEGGVEGRSSDFCNCFSAEHGRWLVSPYPQASSIFPYCIELWRDEASGCITEILCPGTKPLMYLILITQTHRAQLWLMLGLEPRTSLLNPQFPETVVSLFHLTGQR